MTAGKLGGQPRWRRCPHDCRPLCILALLLAASFCQGAEDIRLKGLGQHGQEGHAEGIRRRELQAAARRRKASKLVDGCSIFILDANTVADVHGFPTCNLDDIVVDGRTQVPRLKDWCKAHPEKGVIPLPHYLSANSAPYFTRQAIEASPYLTSDPRNASIIFMDDYCHKLWWLSYVHSETQDQLPGEAIMKIYQTLLGSPMWAEKDGANFAFFQSHTGFAHGELGKYYERLLCNGLAKSMHVVNVRAQRYKCQEYDPLNFMLAPGSVYFPGIYQFQKAEHERLHPMGSRGDRRRPVQNRDLLAFFKGKCTPLRYSWKNNATSVGKMMRYQMVKEIKALKYDPADVRVACTGDQNEIEKDLFEIDTTHGEQMQIFKEAVFCLMLPGDSQTSRRLPEAIMAGCIPVFPGPPYHTLPLAANVNYGKFSVFFKFSQPAWAEGTELHWEIDPDQRTSHPTDAEWWVPDTDIDNLVVQVSNSQGMIEHLQKMPDSAILKLQVEVARVQSRFSYLRQGWGARETAADMVVTRMCQRWAEMNKEPENPFDLFEKDVREMDAGSIDGAILFNEPKVHI